MRGKESSHPGKQRRRKTEVTDSMVAFCKENVASKIAGPQSPRSHDAVFCEGFSRHWLPTSCIRSVSRHVRYLMSIWFGNVWLVGPPSRSDDTLIGPRHGLWGTASGHHIPCKLWSYEGCKRKDGNTREWHSSFGLWSPLESHSMPQFPPVGGSQ